MNTNAKVRQKIRNVNLYILIVSYCILKDFKILSFPSIKLKMPKGEKNQQFVAIKSMFSSGSVRRMKDIETLYPTGVSKAIKINHSRYIQKLHNPAEFKFKHINDLAKLIDIDIQLILDVIKKELNSRSEIVKRKIN